MKAALIEQVPTRALRVDEVAPPRVPAGWLEVAVEACGICGTDLHILAGESYRPELPFVLGHEPVGIVENVQGDDASALLGKRVAPTIFVGCGECRACRAGDERLCERGPRITGVLELWGGFAERLVIAPSQAVVVPDGLGAVEAAALVDAGATAHNAARVAARHQPQGCVVLGAGPVGFLTAALMRRSGSDVLVVEPNAGRREAMRSLGFAVAASFAEVHGPVDAVIDCAGSKQALPAAVDLLGPHGLFLVVGYTTVPDVDLAEVSHRELTVRGIRSGRREDLAGVLELVERGELELPPISRWPLEDINDAFAELRAGRVRGKAVITFPRS